MVKAEVWSRIQKQSRHFVIFKKSGLGDTGHQCKRKETMYLLHFAKGLTLFLSNNAGIQDHLIQWPSAGTTDLHPTPKHCVSQGSTCFPPTTSYCQVKVLNSLRSRQRCLVTYRNEGIKISPELKKNIYK